MGGAGGGEVAVGSGEGMTSGTKPVLPASAVTLAAEGICTAEKFKGHRETSGFCIPSES